MDSPLLLIMILAVLLGPAYARCPWLLVLVGGAGALCYLAPEWSSTIHFFSILALIMTVVGYLVTLMANALELS